MGMRELGLSLTCISSLSLHVLLTGQQHPPRSPAALCQTPQYALPRRSGSVVGCQTPWAALNIHYVQSRHVGRCRGFAGNAPAVATRVHTPLQLPCRRSWYRRTRHRYTPPPLPSSLNATGLLNRAVPYGILWHLRQQHGQNGPGTQLV